MTNTEIIDGLKALRTIHNGNYAPCVDGAIKLLSSEPCEDAVNRGDLAECQELMTDINGHTVYVVRMSDIRKLPPVRPNSKTGHWRAVYQGDEIINYRCTECEYGNTFGRNTYRMNYCPNCGIKMLPTDSEKGYLPQYEGRWITESEDEE